MQSGQPEAKLTPKEALNTFQSMPEPKALEEHLQELQILMEKSLDTTPNPHLPKVLEKINIFKNDLKALQTSKQITQGMLAEGKTLTTDNCRELVRNYEATANQALSSMKEISLTVERSIKTLHKENKEKKVASNLQLESQLKEFHSYINGAIVQFDKDYTLPLLLLADEKVKSRATLATFKRLPELKSLFAHLSEAERFLGNGSPDVKKEIGNFRNSLKVLNSGLSPTIDILTHAEKKDHELTEQQLNILLSQTEESVKNSLRALVKVISTIEDSKKKLKKEIEKNDNFPAQKELKKLGQLEGFFTEVLQKLNVTYHYPLSMLTNPAFKEQHERVERINLQVSIMQKQLQLAENKFTELKMDSSGIRRLKEEFSKFLLVGTIHEEDYKAVEQKIMQLVTEIQVMGGPHTAPMCRRIAGCMAKMREDLLIWRKSYKEYYLALAARFGMSMATGVFSVIVPTVPIIGAAMGSALTPHLSSTLASHAIASAGTHAPSTMGNVIAEEVSSSITTPHEHRTLEVSGQPQVTIREDEKGYGLEHKDYSWQELLIMQSLQTWITQNKKELGLAAVSGIAGGILAAFGVGTPLIFGMLAGASVTGSLSLAGFKERSHLLKEKEIMERIHKELDFIAERYQLLQLGPFHDMEDYRKNTLAFVNEELKKLEPSRLRGSLEYVGVLSAQNKDKIAHLTTIKKMLEDKSFVDEVKDFKYFADNSPIAEVEEGVARAKKMIATIENGLSEMKLESPHTMKLKAAEQELRDLLKDSKDAPSSPVGSTGLFSSGSASQKKSAQLLADFKVSALKKIYDPADHIRLISVAKPSGGSST